MAMTLRPLLLSVLYIVTSGCAIRFVRILPPDQDYELYCEERALVFRNITTDERTVKRCE